MVLLALVGLGVGSIGRDNLRFERVEASFEVFDVAFAGAAFERTLAVGAGDLAATTIHAGLEDKHVALGFHVGFQRRHCARDGERMAWLSWKGANNVAACLATTAFIASARDAKPFAIRLHGMLGSDGGIGLVDARGLR